MNQNYSEYKFPQVKQRLQTHPPPPSPLPPSPPLTTHLTTHHSPPYRRSSRTEGPKVFRPRTPNDAIKPPSPNS